MKAVTAALLAAIVVVLSVIAYDLHRVARALQPSAALSAAVLSIGQPSKETHEQRVQRNMRESRELDEELNASLEADKRLRASRR